MILQKRTGLAHKIDFERSLSIDLETYSEINLKTDGAFKYTAHHSFEILLFSYKWDDGPVINVDLASGQRIPEGIVEAIFSVNVLKTAWNAIFEILCLEAHFKKKMIYYTWECSMLRAASITLPMQLGTCAVVMKAPIQKDFKGAALIKYFCIPCEPTIVNGGRTRNRPFHYPERWREFIQYCNTDVYTEWAIASRLDALSAYDPEERQTFLTDMAINMRGITIDIPFVQNAIAIYDKFVNRLLEEARRLTKLTNPKSVAQLKKWLTEEMELEEEITSLAKADVVKMMKTCESPDALRVLAIRQMLGKSSVSKFNKMMDCVGEDGKIRGLFQLYGASRTWRWAGRLVQLQNLPRNNIKDLDLARKLVAAGDGESLEMFYGNVPAVLSELVRTAFIAGPGRKFNVIDYSAIEACVLAWLANEEWRLKAIRNGEDIYVASAMRMFKLILSAVNDEYRQRGKVAELAFGYGGSVGAATTMDIKKLLREEEKQPLVDSWRAENPRIVKFWSQINDAVIRVLTTGETVTVHVGTNGQCLKVHLRSGQLQIMLPSGRTLTYLKPSLGTNRFGGIGIFYQGQADKGNKWVDLDTYGGKLTENIVQAIARDLLASAMNRLELAGYNIEMHVHDEIVENSPIDSDNMADLIRIMTELPDWAEGLPLKAKGFVTMYYKKD